MLTVSGVAAWEGVVESQSTVIGRISPEEPRMTGVIVGERLFPEVDRKRLSDRIGSNCVGSKSRPSRAGLRNC
jgi:hypothetical protein